MPDAVGGMTDVDHRERVVPDQFKPAGPARAAEARSDGSFDCSEGFAGPCPLQPQQEQRRRDGGVVELEGAAQAHLESLKFVTAELEIEPLSRRRDGLGRYPDLVADKQ